MIGPPDRPTEAIEALARSLPSHRARARLVLLFERTWPLLWPPLGLAGAFLVAALLGLPPLLPPFWHAALLGALTLAELGLAVRLLRRVRLPGAAELDRRLEQASGLAHRPLAVLADKPVVSGADALWLAHLLRSAHAVQRLRTGWPHPGLAARDPMALRAALVVGLVAAFGIAGPLAPRRIAAALDPGFVPPARPLAERLQAWITPPDFTGMAPIFLSPTTARQPAGPGSAVRPLAVPAGSKLGLSLTGGHGAAPRLVLGRTSLPFRALDSGSFGFETVLRTSGRLVVRRGGRTVAAWDLAVIGDPAPLVRFPENPGVAQPGRMPLLRLPWAVSHPYGVVSLRAELRLAGRPQARPLIVPIPLPGGAPKAASGAQLSDLTAHPWAGLPVVARLVGTDAAGRSGFSQSETVTLPERTFANPVARVLIAVRRHLSLHPNHRDAAIAVLDQLSRLATVWAHDSGGYLNLRAIAYLLIEHPAADAVPRAQDRLWALALHLENGLASRTARALEDARRALHDALQQARQDRQRGRPVDQRKLGQLAQALQRALQDDLSALVQQARRNPLGQQFDPRLHPRMTQRMQDLAGQTRQRAETGDNKDARQSFAQLEKMLPMLRNGAGAASARRRQRQQQRQRGRQQLSAVGDVVRHEGALLDASQMRAQAARPPDQLAYPFRPLLPMPPVLGPGAPPRNVAPLPSPEQRRRQAAARVAEQRMQQALRMAIGEVMQQFADLTGSIPPNLGAADAAMRAAGDALARGRDSAAVAAERSAIAALQKGGQAMSQQLARQFGRSGQRGEGQQPGGWGGGRQFGQGQGGMGFGDPWGFGRGRHPQAGHSLDPLGRSTQDGTGGAANNGDVRIPAKMEHMRARDIEQELRRRDASPALSPAERDYIKRLLNTL
ncbi:MAG: DUF4175 family protein [Rhodospirillales bacterium]|nr:DUF4175 family protein [Rhodospirillales bacterium]